MSTHKPPSKADIALFRSSVGPVRRVASDRVQHERKPRTPRPRFLLEDQARVITELLSDGPDTAEIETGDELLYVRPGLQHTLVRRLRRGQLAVQGELDLHGYTVAAARAALAEFLHAAQARGLRCVRVVHGKGRGSRNRLPILKNKVDHWLRQWEPVLAFCSTPRVDGGTGAVYVLLKRLR